MFPTPFKFLAVAILALGVAFASPASHAGETQDFNVLLGDAYANYRTALFQSNTNNQEATQKSLAAFQAKWAALTERFGVNKPPQYLEDAAWSDTLAAVAKLAQDAQDQAQGGNLAEAHNTLEGIRDELTAVRERNGVVSFSDRINAYHTEMEHVLTAGYSAETLNDESLNTLREQIGVLAYLAATIERMAPAVLKANAEFNTLLKALHGSVSDLRAATNGGDKAAIVKAVGALKPAYAKLFAKFG